MDSPPIYRLPQDTLHMIFTKLPLRDIIICRSISKPFNNLLTSPSFCHLIFSLHPPLSLLALRPPHHHTRHRQPSPLSPPPPILHAFDPSSDEWLRFDLTFLPFTSLSPVTSSLGQIYLWGDSPDSPARSLVVCNPLTRAYRVLPQLGSAWSKHGSVLSGSGHRVLVLTELATLYWCDHSNNCNHGFNKQDNWLKFSSNLPSKPRSPILVGSSLYALCDVGSPWRSIWKLFSCNLPEFETTSLGWSRVERSEWGDVFDILKRPRLVKGVGSKILMVGGLKSSFSLNASCSTILILRLDLESLEWDEAGRMPLDMYKCFQESSKFKVFGGGDKVCFSAKRVGKLALWDNSAQEVFSGSGGEWRWIEGAPGYGDGLLRGFVFDACLGTML
ncbi:SKP1-interacting partner 15-like [Chenopodium quinoa]|uniref:SKP1-interacting partner 15-like n=1 Tax=Chenopodium quinoa TaxID=63459 RepID=UPI000B77254C|nr:SKP1-interacting partner 15-like [Chenopodium quinoa]